MTTTLAPLYYLLLALFQHTNQIDAFQISNKIQESSRIAGGTETTISSAKFVVNLRRNGIFQCGGSLVTPTIVVTAAHCVDGLSASELSVVGGATYLSDKGIERSVAKIIIPNEYNPTTVDMDIAILELSSDMEGANISTIDLCTSTGNANDIITVYGWGQISECNTESSNQLRMVRLPIIEQAECSDYYEPYWEITPSMFCAGNLKGKGTCSGDSGGPAVFQNQLCGVVSWGCCRCGSKSPGVYTNIMSVRDFIDNAIDGEGEN